MPRVLACCVVDEPPGPPADYREASSKRHAGWYRPVHVKTVASQELPLLLTNRKLLVNKPDLEPEAAQGAADLTVDVDQSRRRYQVVGYLD
jgi:hypothetical protein